MTKCSIDVEISIKDIIWMLDNKDKLDPWWTMWIDEFTRLMLGESNETSQMGMVVEEDEMDLERINNETHKIQESQEVQDNRES